MSRRIAFIHYPHGPESARLETMPFAFNTVLALAQAGWQVDLYVWEKSLRGELISDYSQLLPDTVTTYYFRDLHLSPLYKWRHLWYKFRFQRSYTCVFGVGQVGAYIGHQIAQSSRCPFIHIVDEFPSNWPVSHWTKLEQLAAQEASLLIVPDEQQFPLLASELAVPSTKPYAVLPNVALMNHAPEPINWHQRLGLPPDSMPFLYAGSVSLSDWNRIPELLTTVSRWPEPAVLVMHSRSRKEIQSFRAGFPELELKDRIFWSDAPLPQHELNSLVAYCAGNFALYRNIGPHIEYIGFSSGKLMRSLVCGSPVIATQLKSFQFVQEHDLGVLIDEEQEIPEAVQQLMEQRELYRQRCLHFCQTHVSFEAYWPEFCQRLKQATKFDLASPPVAA